VLSEDENLPIYDNGMSTYQALYALADAYNKKAAYDLLHEKYSPAGGNEPSAVQPSGQ